MTIWVVTLERTETASMLINAATATEARNQAIHRIEHTDCIADLELDGEWDTDEPIRIGVVMPFSTREAAEHAAT